MFLTILYCKYQSSLRSYTCCYGLEDIDTWVIELELHTKVPMATCINTTISKAWVNYAWTQNLTAIVCQTPCCVLEAATRIEAAVCAVSIACTFCWKLSRCNCSWQQTANLPPSTPYYKRRWKKSLFLTQELPCSLSSVALSMFNAEGTADSSSLTISHPTWQSLCPRHLAGRNIQTYMSHKLFVCYTLPCGRKSFAVQCIVFTNDWVDHGMTTTPTRTIAEWCNSVLTFWCILINAFAGLL